MPGQPLRGGRSTQPHPMWTEAPVSMRRSIREEAAPCPLRCVPPDTQEPLGGASASPVHTPILWVGPGWARVPQPPLRASSPRPRPVAGRSQLCRRQRGARSGSPAPPQSTRLWPGAALPAGLSLSEDDQSAAEDQLVAKIRALSPGGENKCTVNGAASKSPGGLCPVFFPPPASNCRPLC